MDSDGGSFKHKSSLPTRERGLKSAPERPLPCEISSLPTRERGLK